MQLDGRKLMADAKFYESYSRWDSNKGRYETWEESVDLSDLVPKDFFKEAQHG